MATFMNIFCDYNGAENYDIACFMDFENKKTT